MNKKMKKIVLLAAVAVMVLGVVGATLALLVASSEPVVNTFTPTQVTCEVVETFDHFVKTNVSIKNTGDIPAFIRAAIVVTWQDAAGNVYGKTPVLNTDYSLDLNLSETGWVKNGDYYYYTQVVAPNNKTGDVLITEAMQLKDGPADGYNLCIEILADAIQPQFEAQTDYQTAWAAINVDPTAAHRQ